MLEPDPEVAVEYGIFSVRQARAAGFSRADIERLVRRETWERFGKGVLGVRDRAPRSGDQLVRAALAAGPDAVVAGLSAADLRGWDLRFPPAAPKLITPLGCTRPGAYRSALSAQDVQVWGPIRLTSPDRTALDVASGADFVHAVVALDSGMRAGDLSREQLFHLFAASRHRDIRTARQVLEATDDKSGSVPETEARLLFARSGLPAPTTQYALHLDGRTMVLDFAWEEAMLAAEIDGFKYHSAEGDFQQDRLKQNAVQLEGWMILRFTVRDIRQRGDAAVAALERGLWRLG